jgi:hypothetical protein
MHSFFHYFHFIFPGHANAQKPLTGNKLNYNKIPKILQILTTKKKVTVKKLFLPPAAKGDSFEKPPPLESPVKLFIKKQRREEKK